MLLVLVVAISSTCSSTESGTDGSTFQTTARLVTDDATEKSAGTGTNGRATLGVGAHVLATDGAEREKASE